MVLDVREITQIEHDSAHDSPVAAVTSVDLSREVHDYWLAIVGLTRGFVSVIGTGCDLYGALSCTSPAFFGRCNVLG